MSININHTSGKISTSDKDLKLDTSLNLFNSEAETLIFNSIKSEKINTNQFVKIDFNNLIESVLANYIFGFIKHVSRQVLNHLASTRRLMCG